MLDSATASAAAISASGIDTRAPYNRFHAAAHVGHDCRVGDDTVLATHAVLGGHTVLRDGCHVEGLGGTHQFVTIGRRAWTRSHIPITEDVPPFMWIDGNHFEVKGVNPACRSDALENASIQYRTDTGLGGATSPFTGSIGDFARGLIETQARNADLAARVQEGQEVVVTSLMDRFAEKSAVDVDEEMSKLLQLQSAYAANARVISTVKEMIDVLLAM